MDPAIASRDTTPGQRPHLGQDPLAADAVDEARAIVDGRGRARLESGVQRGRSLHLAGVDLRLRPEGAQGGGDPA